MCKEICDGSGAGICDGAPSTCSSFLEKIGFDISCKLSLGFDISCKLSPKETICINCQILFSGNKEK